MKAVVFKGPGKVAIEDRPVPTIQDDTDVIIKVRYTALCGSEMHVYRGHQKSPTEFIMGHEFTGTITEVGKGVKKFKKGDVVVSPFTLSCLECFYCKNGFSSRCAQCKLFGTAILDGAQAEYCRVPLADGTLFPAPEGMDEATLVLMADIFPTGYFAAYNGLNALTPEQRKNATVVLIGCGPVGLCGLISALTYVDKVYAIDSVPERLEEAKKLGAIPLHLTKDNPKDVIMKATEGRGADVVLEIVGMSDALRLGFDLLRPWGRIASVGVHNAEVPFTGNEAYGKNLSIQFGRCPVRSIFPQALELLKKRQKEVQPLLDRIVPLSQAVEMYDAFDKRQVQKVIFKLD